jgi:hypothetical protein
MSELKLEAGKFYRTNAGNKVDLVEFSKTNDLWLGYNIIIQGYGYRDKDFVSFWDKHGKVINEDSANDLIAEWVEPTPEKLLDPQQVNDFLDWQKRRAQEKKMRVWMCAREVSRPLRTFFVFLLPKQALVVDT